MRSAQGPMNTSETGTVAWAQTSSLPESRFDIDVCRIDESGEGAGIDFATRPELHVAAPFASPFQELRRVVEQRTKEEADVDVILVGVDVPKGGVTKAGGRTAVVHQFANVPAKVPHACEPRLYERAQVVALPAEPGVDRRVMFHRGREPEDVFHCQRRRSAEATSSDGLMPGTS